MTVQAQFMPPNYDVFAGLDVDKKSMAVIFIDHLEMQRADELVQLEAHTSRTGQLEQLMDHSLRPLLLFPV